MQSLPIACFITLFLFTGAFVARQAGGETWENQCRRGRIELAAAPEQCPCCGFSPVAVILYAEAPPRQSDLDAGLVIRGGCIVTDDDPKWKCTRCNAVFYSKETS